jgi:hypothetical protein
MNFIFPFLFVRNIREKIPLEGCEMSVKSIDFSTFSCFRFPNSSINFVVRYIKKYEQKLALNNLMSGKKSFQTSLNFNENCVNYSTHKRRIFHYRIFFWKLDTIFYTISKMKKMKSKQWVGSDITEFFLWCLYGEMIGKL